MNRPRLAELATKLLREHPRADKAHLDDRAGTVAALERALAARARRRRPWPLLLVGVAAAAAIAIVGVRLLAPADARVTARLTAAGSVAGRRAGAEHHYAQGESVLAGDQVRAFAATNLTLSTGTTIAIAAASELDVLELGRRQRLTLQMGHLRARVHKLAANEEFSVTTPHALVSVRGTEFDVDVAPDQNCSGRPATRVRVFEGVVAVAHESGEERLLPGQSWTSGCHEDAANAAAARPTQAPPAAPVATAPVAHPAGRHRAADVITEPAPAIGPSTLTEQNDLFAQALAARRQGDKAAALRQLDDLLTRFPQGPLAAAAARARRELAATGP